MRSNKCAYKFSIRRLSNSNLRFRCLLLTAFSLICLSNIISQSLSPSLYILDKLTHKSDASKFTSIMGKIKPVAGSPATKADVATAKTFLSSFSSTNDNIEIVEKMLKAVNDNLLGSNLKEYDRIYLKECFQYLRDKDKTIFSIFGEGTLRDNIEDSEEDSNVTGGSIGVAFMKGRTAIGLTFNLADPPNPSNIDSSYFGKALISPSLESLSFLVEAEHFFKNQNKFFLSFFLLGSSNTWNLDGQNLNAGIFSGNLKLNYMPFHVKSEEIGSACLWFDLGITMRSLFGDVSKSARDNVRVEQFSTDKTTFYGAELGVNLKIGKTLYYARLPYIAGTASTNIDGLTGLRLVIGARVTSDFLKIKK